ncbi:hypothetical protein EMEDMD4_230027 [Sinorhizobium medicae]|uniref:Uncharacterized protein n=1 Tax=Sinorhizobium medicae TaxID=110321 RepID=A0A508WUE4_9HYPH|nr:hypothetical protein EMEDMD4_230027 [Sinorhizobium medicae]
MDEARAITAELTSRIATSTSRRTRGVESRDLLILSSKGFEGTTELSARSDCARQVQECVANSAESAWFDRLERIGFRRTLKTLKRRSDCHGCRSGPESKGQAGCQWFT